MTDKLIIFDTTMRSDTDIVAASAKAYINAINRAYSISNKIHPQV